MTRGRFLSVFVRGASMKPTLPEAAAVLVEPNNRQEIRRGDVIVLRVPDSRVTVVHRVVSVSGNRLVTKGDANDRADPWMPSQEDVIGKVSYVFTGSVLRPVHGGRVGVCTAAGVMLCRFVARALLPVVRPLVLRIVRHRSFSWIRTLAYKPRVVCFTHHGKTEHFLLVGRKVVGRFEPELGQWGLIHPYSAFIDVDELPQPTQLPRSQSS